MNRDSERFPRRLSARSKDPAHRGGGVSERTENKHSSLRCCAALPLQAENSPRLAAGRIQLVRLIWFFNLTFDVGRSMFDVLFFFRLQSIACSYPSPLQAPVFIFPFTIRCWTFNSFKKDPRVRGSKGSSETDQSNFSQ